MTEQLNLKKMKRSADIIQRIIFYFTFHLFLAFIFAARVALNRNDSNGFFLPPSA